MRLADGRPSEEIGLSAAAAAADALYLNMGVLSPDEVRRSRFGEHYCGDPACPGGCND